MTSSSFAAQNLVESKIVGASSKDKNAENNGGTGGNDGLVWRFCIDMDSVAKRPYDPSIELATHPGEKAKTGAGDKMPPTLSLTFRTRYDLYYILEGLRLPAGVDRYSIQCYWRSSDQHAVIWAPCTAETPANAITGVSISYNGYTMERKEMDWRQIMTFKPSALLHSSKSHKLEVRVTNVPVMGSRSNDLTIHNCSIPVVPVAYECQILDGNAAEKLRTDEEKASLELEKRMEKDDAFNGDGDYEKQYWFRNPKITFNHYEDEKKEDEKGNWEKEEVEEEGELEEDEEEEEEEEEELEEDEGDEDESESEVDEEDEEVNEDE